MKLWVVIALALTGASVAHAHSGVKNEAVKARMAVMDKIQDATGVIGRMAKGKLPFDAAQAASARAALIGAAGQVPALFEASEGDPKSEALPAIWDHWDDFAAKAGALEAAATALKTGTQADLGAGMRVVGQSCGGCHKLYRLEK